MPEESRSYRAESRNSTFFFKQLSEMGPEGKKKRWPRKKNEKRGDAKSHFLHGLRLMCRASLWILWEVTLGHIRLGKSLPAPLLSIKGSSSL